MRRVLLVVVLLAAVAAPAFAIWPFSAKTYQLTVVGGVSTGTGVYKSGTHVPITAIVPAGSNFAAWLSGGPDAWGTRPSDFQNPNAVSTTFTMPSHDALIQATYSGQ